MRSFKVQHRRTWERNMSKVPLNLSIMSRRRHVEISTSPNASLVTPNQSLITEQITVPPPGSSQCFPQIRTLVTPQVPAIPRQPLQLHSGPSKLFHQIFAEEMLPLIPEILVRVHDHVLHPYLWHPNDSALFVVCIRSNACQVDYR